MRSILFGPAGQVIIITIYGFYSHILQAVMSAKSRQASIDITSFYENVFYY